MNEYVHVQNMLSLIKTSGWMISQCCHRYSLVSDLMTGNNSSTSVHLCVCVCVCG